MPAGPSPRSRSANSTRGSHAPPGRTGDPCTGEVAQVVACPAPGRYARCGTPKQDWSGCERCSPEATGELLEIERLTSSLERGHRKSSRQGNSLVAYSTASTVRGGGHATPEKVNGPYSTQRRVGGGPGSFSTPADRSASQKLSTPVRRCPRLCGGPSRRLGRRPQPSQWPGGCRADAEGTRPARSYPGPPWGFSTPRSSDAPLRTASA